MERAGSKLRSAACAALAVLAGSWAVRDVSAAQEPTPGQTVGTPARVLDDGALRAAYLDLLGRPPFAPERAQWLGKPRHELCDALLNTPEFWQQWLEEQLYYFFLIDNFRPESERVTAIPSDLAAGKLNVRDAVHRIALCPSFDQRNPGADTFVTVVMEQLDGIKVQKNPRELEIGKAIYDGESGTFLGKSGSSQADIVRIAIEDKSFSETYLAREYKRLVRREPDRKQFAEWSRRFQRDPSAYTAIVREWILSSDWDERLAHEIDQPNRLFVRSMFVDLLGRLPDDAEARRLRTALDGLSDPGPLRSVLARVLIDSTADKLPPRLGIPDPEKWVTDLFRRLLGRDPTAVELATFAESLNDTACRPATVIYAIVTHPEYQSY